MKHLTREELIDSLEQTLPAARAAHAASCATCRGEQESLRRVLDRVVAVDLPEPSPLFWEHFSARVRERVAQQPVPRPSRWPAWAASDGSGAGWSWSALSWPKWAVASATVLVCFMLAWVGVRDFRHAGRHVVVARPGAAGTDYAASTEAINLPSDIPSDEDWNLVVSMAEDVTIDESEEAGSTFTVRPGATERAMADLSSDQRRELANILAAEMGRPSS
jgi:hypothetical protein